MTDQHTALETASLEVKRLTLTLEEATQTRDNLIKDARAQGMTLEQIGQHTGLSKGRIHQITS